MKTRVLFLFILCLGFSPIFADDDGEISIILEEFIKKYENAKTPVEKSRALGEIIIEASYFDMNIAQAYLKELRKLSESSKNISVNVRLLNVEGVMSYVKEEPLDTILNWYSKALNMLRDNNIKDVKQEISLFNNRAIAYEQEKMLDLALKEYTAGIDYLNSLEEKSYLHEVLLYSNIANMLSGVERFDEALEYILKAEEINNILTEKSNKPTEYFEYIPSTKGYILYELKQFDEAEKVLEDMLAFDNSLNLTNNYGKILLGTVYSENDKVELGRSTLRNGLDEAIKLDLGISNKAFASMSMAELELAQENPTTSLKHMDYVYELYTDQEKEIDDSEIHEIMAKVLERSGRFEESLIYTKEYQKLKTEEKERENSTKLQEFQYKMKDIEKQYQINEFEIKQKLQDSKMSMLIVAFLLSVLLMFFVYFLYKRKEEHNKELLQINREVTLAKDKALAAAKAKENFLSTMSHEMRTPMNAIIGITNILLDENTCPNRNDHLENMKFSGEGLLHIINEVLDFSKIEASKLRIIKNDFHLQNFLDNTINSLRHGNKNRNVKIFQDQQLAELNHTIKGDEKRINQILTNLLGNAIKFTNEGHIVLRSRIKEISQDKVKVIFQVEDSGIGIPQDKQNSIFESFSQVNNEINRIHQGTGLGLSISKKLVELQGGKIEVTSTEGKGSTFSFELEFDKGALIQRKKIVKKESKIFKSGIEGRRILLVEDNKLNQLVALKVLKKFKVETALAQNGQEAVDMVKANEFDLILMDIHMPIMDGIEATETIRALEDPSKNLIPIVALSADAYSDKVKAATECGMNDYLSKPFKPEDLFKKIQNNLGRSWSMPG